MLHFIMHVSISFYSQNHQNMRELPAAVKSAIQQPLSNAKNNSQPGSALQSRTSSQDTAGLLTVLVTFVGFDFAMRFQHNGSSVMCHDAGHSVASLLPATDVEQRSQASTGFARTSATPVLLVFACGEEGQQHTEALQDALSNQLPNLQLISGFQLFSEAQTMESSLLQFHGGVVSACAKAWQKYQADQGHTSFMETLQSQLALAGEFVAQYQQQIKDIWKSLKGTWETGCAHNTQAFAAEFMLKCLVMRTQLTDSVRHLGANFAHMTGSELGEQLAVRAQAMSSSTDLQAVLTSTSELCWTLPQFLSSFSNEERRLLVEVLSKVQAEVVWQQAALAAFLIQDPQEVTALNTIVQKSRVELLVTMTLQCTKFTLSRSNHVNGLYNGGQVAQCDVSVQLYAYTSQQMQGVLLPRCMVAACDGSLSKGVQQLLV